MQGFIILISSDFTAHAHAQLTTCSNVLLVCKMRAQPENVWPGLSISTPDPSFLGSRMPGINHYPVVSVVNSYLMDRDLFCAWCYPPIKQLGSGFYSRSEKKKEVS